MKKERVLIAGSSGMLGKDIVHSLLFEKKYDVFGISRSTFDKAKILEYSCNLTNFDMVKKILTEVKPDILINCAANVNVDSCERNKSYAYKINAEVARALAAYIPHHAKYIYISTDSVFDGTKGDYAEDDEPYPLNHYAFTKLEGERLVLKEKPKSIIIRTNIYGFHIPSGKSLVEWAIEKLKQNEIILGFEDVYFNPVYTKQLSRAICKLIHIDYEGLINIGCKEKLSKYDFLINLANIFNIKTNLIKKSRVSQVGFMAKRPKNTILDIKKINKIVNTGFSIENGLQELYNDFLIT